MFGWRLLQLPVLVFAGGVLTSQIVEVSLPWGTASFAAWLVFGSVIEFVLYRTQNRSLRGQSRSLPGLDEQAISASELVFEQELERAHWSPWREETWSWNQLEHARQQRDLPRVRAIVEKALEPSVQALERPGHLLERETVPSALGKSRRSVLIIGVLGLVAAVFHAIHLDWIGVVSALVFAGLFLGSLPPLRQFSPFVDSRPPVAGVGCVETFDGRKWTVDNAILLVSAPSAEGPLFVRLVGEAGWLTMNFMGPDDADFEVLWQRWMHPKPRPELRDVPH